MALDRITKTDILTELEKFHSGKIYFYLSENPFDVRPEWSAYPTDKENILGCLLEKIKQKLHNGLFFEGESKNKTGLEKYQNIKIVRFEDLDGWKLTITRQMWDPASLNSKLFNYTYLFSCEKYAKQFENKLNDYLRDYFKIDS